MALTEPKGIAHLAVDREVAATPEAVGPLRDAVAALAEVAGLAPGRVHDVRLAVSEAATNVVLHAYREQTEPGRLQLTAHLEPDALVVCVRDEGLGLTPRIDSPGAGLGLPLIAKLADALEVRACETGEGTQVSMRFERNYTG